MKILLKNAAPPLNIQGAFCKNSFIQLSKEAHNAINKGTLKLTIKRHATSGEAKRIKLTINATSGNISVSFGGNDQEVYFGHGSKGKYTIRLTGNSKAIIGARTTSNGTTLYCNNSGFVCGEDCMFSSDVLLQASDQHGIIDLNTGSIINNDYSEVMLGDHVWLGRKCTLTAKTQVGNGSIIATGAIVSGSIPKQVLAAGVPARIIKTEVTWSRELNSMDELSQRYLIEYQRLCSAKLLLYCIWIQLLRVDYAPSTI